MTNLLGANLHSRAATARKGEGQDGPSNFARYPEYKDSGVEWLGKVPAHWLVAPFKWQVERNDGGVWGDDPDGIADTIVLRSTEQTVDGQWSIDDPAARKLSESDRGSGCLVAGDLLMTKSSGSALHIGKTTLVTKEIADMGCCYSNFMQRIRVRSGLVPKFFWYVMNNELARVQFSYLSNSTTGLANLNGTMVGQLLLALPSENEQSAIVSFLDEQVARLEELISEQERLIALLKEKRQAVISHAVTKGIDPNVPMKDSGIEWLGEVPAHWDVVPLKYLVSLKSGGTPSKDNIEYWDGAIPWASAKDLKVDLLLDTTDHISELAIGAGAAALVPAESVLIVVRGMILARMFPVSIAAVPMAINQDLKALLSRGRLIAGYLAALLKGIEQESLARLDEAGHGTKALRMGAWTSIEIPVPPLEEQGRILSYLEQSRSRIDALVNEAEIAVVLLIERRAALISAAVTGAIDVRA